MKYLSFLLVLVAVFPCFLSAQNNVPRLSKMAIGQSGCYGYFPAGMSEFTPSKSEDGADVYTGEAEVDGFHFACITVKFAEPFTDSSPEEMEELLISYMAFLQEQFGITTSAGVGRGHTLETAPDARGVIDYWEGADSVQYAVKGWVNPKALAIMMIYGATEYPIFNLQQMYLDGFRFSDN
ncbi:MAG: hypothetical protein IT258_00255 [Saprospiraceae bacterium]|nr:hypothetical protein [Saprospiraceae bacterium]